MFPNYELADFLAQLLKILSHNARLYYIPVTAQWRKLHKEELHDLHSLPSIIRIIKLRMRWAGHVARMGEEEECIQVVGGRARGKEATRKTKT
jgi:hypothetical protein